MRIHVYGSLDGREILIQEDGREDREYVLPDAMASVACAVETAEERPRVFLATAAGQGFIKNAERTDLELVAEGMPTSTQVRITTDGRVLAWRTSPTTIHFLPLEEPTQEFDLDGGTLESVPSGLAFSKDGTVLTAWARDGAFQTWNTAAQ